MIVVPGMRKDFRGVFIPMQTRLFLYTRRWGGVVVFPWHADSFKQVTPEILVTLTSPLKQGAPKPATLSKELLRY